MGAGHRGQGESAVAAYDGGEALGQLRFAEAGAQQRRVGVAVDVDEARGEKAAQAVNGADSLRAGELSHGGDLSAGESGGAGIGRSAGAVQDLDVSDQVVEHKKRLRCLFW